jgi:hypothetical protein
VQHPFSFTLSKVVALPLNWSSEHRCCCQFTPAPQQLQQQQHYR